MSATITFFSGAGTVTGANFLLDTNQKKILIDCGTLERERPQAGGCDEENGKPFAYDPGSIDALIVTHAHADHIGRVPKLVRDGFRGQIFSTTPTRDLAELMFEDALHIMEEEAMRAGCRPIYQKEDVSRALSQWQTRGYHEHFSLGDATVEFLDAGHILGSAMVRFTREKSIIFTGDLGNSPEPLLNDTESPAGAHYIVMESVYGDRVHEGREGRKDALRAAIEEVRARKGVLLMPSFSIERTQILLFEIDSMIEAGEITPIPLYLDAPLAIAVTDIFRKYPDFLNPAARAEFEGGKDPFTFSGLKVTKASAQSREIYDAPNPKVIIAGAGMSSGGRIRAHEKHYLPDKNATVLFVGYQAPGSLGRRIQDGEKHVHIEGESVRVRANIEILSGYSGHKDRDALLEFVEAARESLQKVFVVMGEPKAEMFLAQRIRDFLGVETTVPQVGSTVSIEF
jgi:metallo-beta-lactamase family protein